LPLQLIFLTFKEIPFTSFLTTKVQLDNGLKDMVFVGQYHFPSLSN
jgi:hypothetical protein